MSKAPSNPGPDEFELISQLTAKLLDRRIEDAAKENLLRNRRDGDGHHH